jgi:hypothetical protein
MEDGKWKMGKTVDVLTVSIFPFSIVRFPSSFVVNI